MVTSDDYPDRIRDLSRKGTEEIGRPLLTDYDACEFMYDVDDDDAMLERDYPAYPGDNGLRPLKREPGEPLIDPGKYEYEDEE